MGLGPLAKLIHPRLQADLTRAGFNSQQIDLQVPVTTRSSGGDIRDNWVTVPGLTGLPCRIEDPRQTATSVTERRDPTYTVDVNEWAITIAGYYPTISTAMRAVDFEGNAYDIVGVSWDNEHTQTVLMGQMVDL